VVVGNAPITEMIGGLFYPEQEQSFFAFVESELDLSNNSLATSGKLMPRSRQNSC
jgi:hypothetical protein